MIIESRSRHTAVARYITYSYLIDTLVFGKLKEAFPSKKQIADKAAAVGTAKIDKLDQAGLTDKKTDIDVIDDDKE